jgi:hypothetical protein
LNRGAGNLERAASASHDGGGAPLIFKRHASTTITEMIQIHDGSICFERIAQLLKVDEKDEKKKKKKKKGSISARAMSTTHQIGVERIRNLSEHQRVGGVFGTALVASASV